jgi:hypothetical protein
MKLIPSICNACGFAGYPRQMKAGSTGLAILLWCFFLIPGFLYSLWRAFAPRTNRCPQCGGMQTMIPVGSVIGQRLVAELQAGSRQQREADALQFVEKFERQRGGSA